MAEKTSGGWWKWILIVVLVAAVIGGFLYFRTGSAEALSFNSAPVTRGELTQAVTATGTLNPVVNVTVGSQVSGRISKLNADFNSPVTKGEVIAEIDPATYQATVEQVTADLANARANLELQQAQFQRSSNLITSKLISGSEYDVAVATLHSAEATVKIKQAALNSAIVNLGYCKILSPVDGTVISRNVDIGQTVAASLSAPTIFVIANDLSKMQINANVSEADIGSIEDGQNVSFSVDAFPDRKFTGKVNQIRNSPTTVQNVVTYDVIISVSNPDLKLRPGMTANAAIITAERAGALKIPNAALRFRLPESAAKELKPAATNEVTATKAGGTNGTAVAAAAPPLTGNEPPEELQRRVAELRERGEEISPAVRAKLRELYSSGVLQRPAGQGGGRGGSGGGASARASAPAARTVYILVTDKKSTSPTPQAVRVKTGISDGNYTEITDGLKEGEVVITSVKLSTTTATAPAGASPFGGGSSRGGR